MTNLVRGGVGRGRVRGTCLEGPCSALGTCGDVLGVCRCFLGYSRLTRVPGRGNGIGGGCEGTGTTSVVTRHPGLVGKKVRCFGLGGDTRTLGFFKACMRSTSCPVLRGRGLTMSSALLPRVTCCTALTTGKMRSGSTVLGCTPVTVGSGSGNSVTVRL